MNEGQLVKMTIEAYKNKKLTKPIKEEHQKFTIPVNPESYTENFKVEWDKKKGQGNQRTNPRFKSSETLEYKFEFILDGTQTIEGYQYPVGEIEAGQTGKLISVRKQIKRFLKTVYQMNCDIHKPNFLKLAWGSDFVLHCVLSNLDINYTLFRASGEPLRAKINATFLDYVEQERRSRKEDKKSPDLTTKKQIPDTLPLSAFDLYGDANLYLQIAKVNQLTSIRNIDKSQEFVFPPLDKTTA